MDSTTFFEAIKKGNLEIIKKLIAAGADVHQTGEDGNAILSLFNKTFEGYGESSDKDVLKYLLDCGVDPKDILSEFKYLADDIKDNTHDMEIDPSFLNTVELLQILADNWGKGRKKIETIIEKSHKVIQKIKDKRAAPPKKSIASEETINEFKATVLEVFHRSFVNLDWDEEKILNTNLADEDELEGALDLFFDDLSRVFNLDDEDYDDEEDDDDDDDDDEIELDDDVLEGTISEIIHKLAEMWDGQK